MAENLRCKIMVVDDDPDLNECFSAWLKKAGFSVVSCFSGREMAEKLQRSQPDAVLMDVMLGDADGVELCRGIRADPRTRHIPVILISASRTKEEDALAGLYEGADDYLVKPVTPQMLVAKLGVVLRRARAPQEIKDVLRQHDIALNVAERKVEVRGREVQLTRKEFDLLTVLLRKEGNVLNPKFLLETVWGYELEDYNDTHTVEVHISSLKKKLGQAFASQITNVVGSGYRFGGS